MVDTYEVGLDLDAGAVVVEVLLQAGALDLELDVERGPLRFEVAHAPVVLRHLCALGSQIAGMLVSCVTASCGQGGAFCAGVGGPESHLGEDEERAGGEACEAAADGGGDVVVDDAVRDDAGRDEHHQAGREGSDFCACGCVVHPYPRLSLGCYTPAVVGVALGVLNSLLPFDRRAEHLARYGV
ncbi:hypothetical protein ACIGD1_11520 [Streptomyces sp. NPDC085612]|uniref:hypothetical protein n=1 Tax=Streptomyces sp. NPDC085612 TaxID=3365732 RepID=UPI0037D28B81